MGLLPNPWADLRRLVDVELAWELLPDDLEGLYCPNGDGTATIVLDARLGRVTRRATLQHEIVHHERGITGDPRTDERGVEDEVARRLVPFGDLYAMWQVAVLNDLPCQVHEVAARFDVPDRVAELAMRMLLRRLAS